MRCLMEKEKRQRIWELDFLRGIALIMMIYFHVIYDMKDIYGYDVVYSYGINYWIGKISASMFILISGVSSTLSRSNVKRGLRVLAAGMAITLITYLYDPEFIIKFGILHFLGISMLLYPLFQKMRWEALAAIGTAVIIVGKVLERINAPNDYFFAFGLTSSSFFSSDYYPLLPWFGLFLYGVLLGKLLYSQRKSLFGFSLKDNIISSAGRHTLAIYLIHQPVIIAVLSLINRLAGK